MVEDRALLLKADYSAQPFWRRDGSNVSIGLLPLTEQTRVDLQAWTEWFDTSAYWEHSSETAVRYFPSDEEHDAFETEGLRLWLKVREEAGAHWLIGYFSLTRQERVWDPSQLPRGLFPANLTPPPAATPQVEAVTAEPVDGPVEFVDEMDVETVAFEDLDEYALSDTGEGSGGHAARMANDPVYAEAYERTLAQLTAKPGDQPHASAPSTPTPDRPAPMTQPLSHDERMATDPVYADAYRRALGGPAPAAPADVVVAEPGDALLLTPDGEQDVHTGERNVPAAPPESAPAGLDTDEPLPERPDLPGSALPADVLAAATERIAASAAAPADGWRLLLDYVLGDEFAAALRDTSHATAAPAATAAAPAAASPADWLADDENTGAFADGPDFDEPPAPAAEPVVDEPTHDKAGGPVEAEQEPAEAAPAGVTSVADPALLPHEQRLLADPVYREAFERQMRALRGE